MFDYPYQKPKTVSGEDLANWFAKNSCSYYATHCVDRSQDYVIYGYEDHIKYDDKVKFRQENKIEHGRTAWTSHNPSGLYMAGFRCLNKEEEKLTPRVYSESESKSERESAKDERRKEKEERRAEKTKLKAEKAKLKAEKKAYGNARAVESKNKIMAAMGNAPQTAEALAKAADISYATATKMLTKMVDNGACIMITGVKEGAPGKGRHYKKAAEANS